MLPLIVALLRLRESSTTTYPNCFRIYDQSTTYSLPSIFDAQLGRSEETARFLSHPVASRFFPTTVFDEEATGRCQMLKAILLRYDESNSYEARSWLEEQNWLANFSGTSWRMHEFEIRLIASQRKNTESAKHPSSRTDWKRSVFRDNLRGGQGVALNKGPIILLDGVIDQGVWTYVNRLWQVSETVMLTCRRPFWLSSFD